MLKPAMPNCAIELVCPKMSVILVFVILLSFSFVQSAQADSSARHGQIQSVNYGEQASTSNEIPDSFSHLTKDVTNLKLWPDSRSVKLRWTYEPQGAKINHRPSWFVIRYCELTSWRTEIKCRQRDWPVAQRAPQDTRAQQTDAAEQHPSGLLAPPSPLHHNQQRQQQQQARNFSVIEQSFIEQLEPPAGVEYETQIYDLRALTNYTFSVRVSRFVGELSSAPLAEPSAKQPRVLERHHQLARRLDLDKQAEQAKAGNKLQLIETKPFSAEAVRCLANSSEVSIHTGKFFAGRISVEGQNEPACQMLGNKSSDQANYLFRIDHRLCRSKLIDGNQIIETMILVHENRDILTHNTARFLVQCNVHQNSSFTVRASVSLPKVNSFAPVRRALITPLSGRPVASALADQQRAVLRLGSMPGVYRPTRLAVGDELAAESSVVNRANASAANLERRADSEALTGRRQPKELASTSAVEQLSTVAPAAKPFLPTPVDVSSRVLYVQAATTSALSGSSSPASHSRPLGVQSDAAPMHAGSAFASTAPAPVIGAKRSQRANSHTSDSDYESASPPLVMTDNHRVAGDFEPLNARTKQAHQQQAAVAGAPPMPATIKYSPSRVTDFALERVDQQQLTASARSRSGRMRSLHAEENRARLVPAAASADVGAPNAVSSSANGLENRMGDAMLAAAGANNEPPADDTLVRPRANLSSVDALAPESTLTQNITGALLRWSLRALGHLARKSLESLTEPSSAPSSDSVLVLSVPQPTRAMQPLEREQLAATTSIRPVLASGAPPASSLSQSSIARRLPHLDGATKQSHPLAAAQDQTESHVVDARAVSETQSRATTTIRPIDSGKPVESKATKMAGSIAQATSPQRRYSPEMGNGSEESGDGWWPFYAGLGALSAGTLLVLIVLLVPGWRCDESNASTVLTSGQTKAAAHWLPAGGAASNARPDGVPPVPKRQANPELIQPTNSINSFEQTRYANHNLHSQLPTDNNASFVANAFGALTFKRVRHHLQSDVEANKQNIGNSKTRNGLVAVSPTSTNSSTIVASTRSTSAASDSTSSVGDENYCKNNVLVYSDFVLLDGQQADHRAPPPPPQSHSTVTSNESFA